MFCKPKIYFKFAVLFFQEMFMHIYGNVDKTKKNQK